MNLVGCNNGFSWTVSASASIIFVITLNTSQALNKHKDRRGLGIYFYRRDFLSIVPHYKILIKTFFL